MARIVKESIERFYDYDIHIESRTLFIGDSRGEGDNEGEIDADVSQRAIKGFHLLTAAAADKPVTVYINSFGGCFYNGMAIYDAIKACPCHITAYVCGSAMSMGSLILQAADTRLIYPHATMMLHDGYDTRVGDVPQTFFNWAEYSRKMRTVMYKIYADRSGQKPSYWRRKLSNDLILTASEAKELGLVDGIVGD